MNDELVDDDEPSTMPPARSKRLPLFQIATSQESPSPGVTAVVGHFILLEDDKISLLETSKRLCIVDTYKFSDKALKLEASDVERGLIFRFRESPKCLIAYVLQIERRTDEEGSMAFSHIKELRLLHGPDVLEAKTPSFVEVVKVMDHVEQ